MRKRVVIDTNVLMTAEGGPGASRPCIERCQKELLEIRAEGCVALDSGWEIIKEYRTNLSTSRQPGLGFRFLEWVLNTRSAPGHCSWVTITPHESRGYEEFPEHDGLQRFDWSDRKFVAVAAKHSPKLPIVQATDSKWVGWRPALAECGIEVKFICRSEIESKYEKKKKH
jgi:hypothetical protein